MTNTHNLVAAVFEMELVFKHTTKPTNKQVMYTAEISCESVSLQIVLKAGILQTGKKMYFRH